MCLGGHMENTHCAQICAWRSALPTETRGRAWRSRGPQHINKTHIFHMQKYQTISHTAGSPEQCKQPLYLISEPSGTCVSKMCVTPYSSSLFQQFKGPAWHLVCLCWVFFFCMKKNEVIKICTLNFCCIVLYIAITWHIGSMTKRYAFVIIIYPLRKIQCDEIMST